MVGVEIGVIGAGIVLLVPMGMAGWHLSRNKMLFFSCALFITLAVFVHLSPFFPSSFFFSSSSSSSSSLSIRTRTPPPPPPPPLVLENRESCISLLHHIEFHVVKVNPPPPPSPPLLSSAAVSWNWASNSTPVLACDFQKLSLSDASDLLNASWIVIAGDSQSRFFALSLLNLLLSSGDIESVKLDLFKRHSNYHIFIPHIALHLDFIWSPFLTNLTHLLLQQLNHNFDNFPPPPQPDVLVLGSGLWHMLHISNHSDYALSLQLLKTSLLPEFITTTSSFHSPPSGPHLFWLGMPLLINSLLNTLQKREKMSNAAFIAYDTHLHQSQLLRQSGGPLLLLDMHSLSRTCGPHCTLDGIHYHQSVYDAAVHIMLNALLIESHQKL